MSSPKVIAQTERLIIREITADDSAFVLRLINTPKFHRYIADRGVRDVDSARKYVEERYLEQYEKHGYGLFCVCLRDGTQIGNCGFVRRDSLDAPDIGFAFLPEFERQGYGIEAARAVMEYGKSKLGFDRVLAITSLDNDASGALLRKLGFELAGHTDIGDGETLNLYEFFYEKGSPSSDAPT